MPRKKRRKSTKMVIKCLWLWEAGPAVDGVIDHTVTPCNLMCGMVLCIE